jgi:hypothetical protein
MGRGDAQHRLPAGCDRLIRVGLRRLAAARHPGLEPGIQAPASVIFPGALVLGYAGRARV